MYTGKLEFGKSVFLANIVDDQNLREQRSYSGDLLLCRHDIFESLKAHTIISSQDRQL